MIDILIFFSIVVLALLGLNLFVLIYFGKVIKDKDLVILTMIKEGYKPSMATVDKLMEDTLKEKPFEDDVPEAIDPRDLDPADMK